MANHKKAPLTAEELAAWFWGRVWIKGDGECWPWGSGKTQGGYGSAQVPGRGGKNFSAARLCMEVQGKVIPEGMRVTQTCGNHICCNPKHLALAAYRGRKMAFAPRPGRSKITEAMIRGIRLLGKEELHPLKIAVRYDVSEAYVRMVLNGQKRGYVSEEGDVEVMAAPIHLRRVA